MVDLDRFNGSSNILYDFPSRNVSSEYNRRCKFQYLQYDNRSTWIKNNNKTTFHVILNVNLMVKKTKSKLQME